MTGPTKDYDDAVRLYSEGKSIAAVASLYGITRQAMHLILKRRGATMRSNLRFGSDNHFHRGGSREDDRAQGRVEKAILRGRLVRPETCEKCGKSPRFRDGRSGIQAHHADYNKPLDVMWLCQPCHHEWHRTNVAVPRRGAR